MSSITLPLTQLRDILTNFDASAALNAARYHEARQIYAGHDWQVVKRILPAELARTILASDPAGLVFHIDFKAVPVELIDQWTPTAEYAVVCAAQDWMRTAEYQFVKSDGWKRQRALMMAASAEEDRLLRMSKSILAHLPQAKSIHTVLLAEQRKGEHFLQAAVKHFELAIGTPIYELPAEQVPAQASGGREETPGASSETPEAASAA